MVVSSLDKQFFSSLFRADITNYFSELEVVFVLVFLTKTLIECSRPVSPSIALSEHKSNIVPIGIISNFNRCSKSMKHMSRRV